uniref:MRN complex interacting protein n=1 Tax=Equus caballus TaxID=9796 RepID=F7DZU4_HORSE|nr:MRN complex-interacting protein isoform X1 [Equus caballus]
MAQPQQARVLRCCSCRLFQAHQMKKSLKWTCKACGEKQAFLRAYGEGSGADCRRHVQKLNLLQGQVSEMSLRSLEEPVNAGEEENAGPWQAEHARLQGKPQPSEKGWMKDLEGASKGLRLEGGVGFSRQPQAKTEEPEPPFRTGLPRKRKWSQSTVQLPDGQDSGNSELTLEPQGRVGLAGNIKERSSHEDWDTRELTVPQGAPSHPAQQLRPVSSKWERFLLPPGSSSHVDMEPPTPLHRGLRPAEPTQAEQGTLRTQTPRERLLSRSPGAPQLPEATHTLTSGPKRPCGKAPEQLWGTAHRAEGGPSVRGTQEPPLMHLCDLFKTGEDFDDDL